MKGHRFSVIVPVYNVKLYLDRCVRSLADQSYLPYEIILVDDGSTDGSEDLCDDYARKYPFVKVCHKKNGGLSSARNYGIVHSNGDYILFVDSDDYVQKDLCQKLEEALAKYGKADLLSFDGIERCGEKRARLRRLQQEKEKVCSGYEYLLQGYKTRNMNVQAWLYAYRRDFLIDHELFFVEGILHEDVEFMPRVLMEAERVIILSGAYYQYIVRENSISTSKNKEKNIQDLFTTLKKQSDLAEQQDPEMKKWMLNAALNSYLNMIQEARMYRRPYRKYIKKEFMLGKAATPWNHFRVCICFLNVRAYCWLNDCYKNLRRKTK